VFRQNGTWVRLNFAECDGAEARALEAKAEAAYS
jgi:hypothetical protein